MFRCPTRPVRPPTARNGVTSGVGSLPLLPAAAPGDVSFYPPPLKTRVSTYTPVPSKSVAIQSHKSSQEAKESYNSCHESEESRGSYKSWEAFKSSDEFKEWYKSSDDAKESRGSYKSRAASTSRLGYTSSHTLLQECHGSRLCRAYGAQVCHRCATTSQEIGDPEKLNTTQRSKWKISDFGESVFDAVSICLDIKPIHFQKSMPKS